MLTNHRTMMANDKAIPGGRGHTDDDGLMVMIVDESDEAYSPGGRNHAAMDAWMWSDATGRWHDVDLACGEPLPAWPVWCRSGAVRPWLLAPPGYSGLLRAWR